MLKVINIIEVGVFSLIKLNFDFHPFISNQISFVKL